jgi:DNA phosphorothioation-dependent restriction protein DptH
MEFADAMAGSYNLDPIQKSTLVQSVMAAYTHCGITEDSHSWSLPAPTFAQVLREYQERPTSQHNDSLEHILENLAGMELFSGESDTDDRYSSFRGVVVLDLSGYSEAIKNLAAMVILSKFSDRMFDAPQETGLQKLVLVDEADDILTRGCPVLNRIIQEGKDRGVGVMLSARYPDFLQSMGFDCREYMRLWLVHHVEELRKAELEYILGADAYDNSVEQLYQTLRRLERNESLICLENEEPVIMENLPFHDISADTAQSYLRETGPEPEEDLFAGMPELDVTHLETFDLEEDIQLETLDLL